MVTQKLIIKEYHILYFLTFQESDYINNIKIKVISAIRTLILKL